ncbi:hypothetical protein BJY52DRAFT_1227702 [Lactarius psammicola]|nr:hypothetical protein BJY52DRAFT_1227702 [Lactarius psammicola]
MDAGFDPNTPPTLEVTHQTQYGIRDDNRWLLSSSPMEPSPVNYTQDLIQEITVDGAPVQRSHLLKPVRWYIETITSNLKAVKCAKTPNILPVKMRQMIQEAVDCRDETGPLPPQPEVIEILDSSQPGAHGVIMPPTRPQSAASMWTHVTHESIEEGFDAEFGAFFPEPQICDFVESIDQVLWMPVLMEIQAPFNEGSGGFVEDIDGLERIKNELIMEIGWDLSSSQSGYSHFYLNAPLLLPKENTIPASAEDFNLAAGLVIATLDMGVADHTGDLEQTGLTASSWFWLTSGMLVAILHGALHSGGQKICRRVALDPDDVDAWVMAEGLARPVTQGGRVAAMANQVTEFFTHYATNQEPPLADFYHSLLRVGQNHIEKAVHLKAAATYQSSIVDVEGLTKMVLNNMTRQLYNKFSRQESTLASARGKAMRALKHVIEDKAMKFLDMWKKLYMDKLTKACFEDEEERDPMPLTGNILIDDNGIEAACQEMCAAISSEKKAWSVAYRDSNKLEFLKKVAVEPGYVLVPKDDAEEREGRTAKWQAIPDGKCSHSGSRVEDVTPAVDPVTSENKPRRLDQSTTPKARKTKGKRALVIPKPIRSHSVSLSSAPSDGDVDMGTPAPPLFFTSSYPETAAALDKVTLSRIATPDSTRGVASAMHNPSNEMADDPPQPTPVVVEVVASVSQLPQLTAIPLLPGLAKMLNALQTNLISDITKRIDDQDLVIKLISSGAGRAKSKGTTTKSSSPETWPVILPLPVGEWGMLLMHPLLFLFKPLSQFLTQQPLPSHHPMHAIHSPSHPTTSGWGSGSQYALGSGGHQLKLCCRRQGLQYFKN